VSTHDPSRPETPNIVFPRIDWTFSPWGLLGLIAQAGAIIAWGASINERVSTLEASARLNVDTPATLARLDQRTADDSQSLRQLQQDFHQLTQERRP